MPCYEFSGQIQNSAYVSCQLPTDDGFHTCCVKGETCLPNNLCSGPYTYYRGGCTDPIFSSPSCPQFCPENAAVNVHDCGNSTGCCEFGANGPAHADCSCEPGAPGALLLGFSTVQILKSTTSSSTATTISSSTTAIPTATTISTSISTAISSSISTSTSIPTISNSIGAQSAAPTSSNSSASATDSDLKLKVGLPVGILGGIAIVLGVIFLLMRRRRSRSRSHVPMSEMPSKEYMANQHVGQRPFDRHAGAAELSNQGLVELHAGQKSRY